MLSKIANSSPEVCSELLNNGTVKTLVLLLHSQNAYLQVGRSRTEMVEKYMKKADLRKNIAGALSEIINGELELQSGVEKNTSGEKSLSLELTHSERVMISKFVEKIRSLIHQHYEKSYASSSQFNDHSPPSCFEFSSLCIEEFQKVDERMIEKNASQRHYFEQIGGYYVLLDLLTTHFLFHEKECIDVFCRRLMESTFRFFEIVCYTNRPNLTYDLCRQIAGSPFYTAMFVDVFRNFSNNELIVAPAAKIFALVCERMKNFDTLHNCQAIRCFADIMMKAKENFINSEYIIGCMFQLFWYILFWDSRAQVEFTRIEGAVEFVISKFADHFRWARNGQCSRLLEGYPRQYVQLIFDNSVKIMALMTYNYFSTNPEVREVYRKAEVSKILFNVIKETLSKGEFYEDEGRHGYPKSILFKCYLDDWLGLMITILCRIVKNSQSEQDNIRQLADAGFLKLLSTVELEYFYYKTRTRELLNLLETH